MVGTVLTELASALDEQIYPEAAACMDTALQRTPHLPEEAAKALGLLGSGLGRFDLDGQLQGLEQVRSHCRRKLEELSVNREQRVRGYQTLGVCAGAALAILFV